MIVAISMVKDEADIIAATVANMQAQVDHVIVADNGSTDGTRDILHDLGVEVVDDPDPAYRQSEKMTALAHRAGVRHSATWVVPFDADEFWTAPGSTLRTVLEQTTCPVVAATLFDHVATGTDCAHADPVTAMGWRRQAPTPMPKVAARYADRLIIDQGNHSVTYAGRPAPMAAGPVVHHFPYRSAAQFVRKVRNGAAAYAAAPTVRADFGAHWRQWGAILDRDGEDAVTAIFRQWYWRLHPEVPIVIGGDWQPALVWDPCKSPS